MVTEFAQWPQQGCSLNETRGRLLGLPASAEDDLSKTASDRRLADEVMAALAEDQLVGYGTKQGNIEREIINCGFWLAKPAIDWEGSYANASAEAYSSILVCPALVASDRARLVAGHSFKTIFERYVLKDPEVAAWARKAIRASSEFERVFIQGHCYPHGVGEWPLAFERGLVGVVHPDPAKRSPLGSMRKPDPIEAVVASEVLTNRFGALITMLRLGEVEGRAILCASSAPDTVLRSIWSHRDYYVDRDGDLFAINEERDAGAQSFLIRRWVGLVLELPTRAELRSTFRDGVARANGQARAADSAPEVGRADVVSAADLIAAGSLSVALDRLVFAHPEVLALRAAAIAASKKNGSSFYEFANLIGPVTGLDEPVLPLRYFNERGGDFGYPEPEPPPSAEQVAAWEEFYPAQPAEIDACYEGYNRRARDFFALLQGGQVAARGHVADGHLVDISQSLWSHEDYYIHCPTGDLYEAGPEQLEKRFTAVVLVPPPTTSLGRVSREHASLLPSTTAPHIELPAVPALAAVSKHTPSATKAEAGERARLEIYALCVDWLSVEMKRSPDVRQRPKAFWRSEAQKKWTISNRSFGYAWDEAIRNCNAVAWSKAGPPKRAHRNPRND
jgi:hypothetical protein